MDAGIIGGLVLGAAVMAGCAVTNVLQERRRRRKNEVQQAKDRETVEGARRQVEKAAKG